MLKFVIRAAWGKATKGIARRVRPMGTLLVRFKKLSRRAPGHRKATPLNTFSCVRADETRFDSQKRNQTYLPQKGYVVRLSIVQSLKHHGMKGPA